MSENMPQTPEIVKQMRMSNPGEENKPRKIGCLTYCVVIFIIIGVLIWFNIFRGGPPLRISKETTFITEPLTPDGRYVDYFAALQKEMHPPEMQTDDNGFRVVFRALGDINNETSDFVQLQKRYEALGLDAIRDKPTMTFVEPNSYFSNRYTSHPEEFEDIVAAEKEKYICEQEEKLRGEIEEIKVSPDWSEEEKAEFIAELENDIANLQWIRLTKEERKEKQFEKIKADPDLTEEEKAQEIAWLQSPDEQDSLDDSMTDSFMGMGGLFDFSFEPIDAFSSLSNSMTLHKNAIARQWMEENNAALDLVAEQVKKPIFVMPYCKTSEDQLMIGILLPDVQAMRDLARGFSARAQIRLGDGDLDGAIDDIVACYQLGRHVEKRFFLVEGLVGIAIEGIAANIPYDLNSEIRANAEQLKRLQNELAQLTPQNGALHKVNMERYCALDWALNVMKGKSSLSDFTPSSSPSVDSLVSAIGMDWNLIFKKINKAYDESMAGTYIEYNPGAMAMAKLLTLKSRSELAGEYFIAFMLPATEAVKEAYLRQECAMNMKRIILAMYLYEREHGTLPPTFTIDENGKPLHSWRTLLLPYFGDETLAELYKQMKLDEPWDSEHNRQFHERNLDVYRCPSAASTVRKDGESNYSVIVGDDLLFTTDGKGQPLDKCGPIMLLLAERKAGVCWMQPDAEIAQADAENGVNREFWTPGSTEMSSHVSSAPVPISSNHSGGVNFGLRDGGITFISDTIDRNVFCKAIRGEAEERP